MQGYNDVTADALADEAVGGSEKCVAAVRAAFADLGARLSLAEGRRQLERDFNVCGGTGALEPLQARALFAEGAADPLVPQVPHSSPSAGPIGGQPLI